MCRDRGGGDPIWGKLMGLLPRPPGGQQRLRLMPGLLRGWKWDQRLVVDILARGSVSAPRARWASFLIRAPPVTF